MSSHSGNRTLNAAGGRLCRPGGPSNADIVDTMKEGVHGGTMGSPIERV
jgi:hypothetical protein